jgi:hypothetical protein
MPQLVAVSQRHAREATPLVEFVPFGVRVRDDERLTTQRAHDALF